MKKEIVIPILILFIVSVGLFEFGRMTGMVTSGTNSFGPSQNDVNCMMTCMKCTSPGVGCTGNQQQCQAQCNVYKPEQTAEEKCVEECAMKGCGQYDFACQQKNQAACDKQCGMIKEPEAKSEEQRCIQDCVNLHAEGTICKPSQEGEQGNDVCKMCAQQCVHLYAGPCLSEDKLESAKKDCETCEHCYGSPVLGDSGEGWECIVSVECKDASSEFGDEPGTGPGIASQVGGAIGDAVEGVVNFFKGIFGGGESREQTSEPSSDEQTSGEA